MRLSIKLRLTKGDPFVIVDAGGRSRRPAEGDFPTPIVRDPITTKVGSTEFRKIRSADRPIQECVSTVTTTSKSDLDMSAERLRLQAVPGEFGESELVGLAEPVARYFRAAIAPGAPMARAADIDMNGRLRLNGRWLPMRAREVLAPHAGFLWRARIAGVISGFDRCVDGRGEMSWKLLGLAPVARAEGPDIARSSAARAAGESVWLPSSLLPRFGVRWEAESEWDLTARFSIVDVEMALRLRIDDAGLVQRARFKRWGDPDETGEWTCHEFGMVASESRPFGPFTVPAVVRVGWFPGTDRWSEGEFFRCEITALTPVVDAAFRGRRR